MSDRIESNAAGAERIRSPRRARAARWALPLTIAALLASEPARAEGGAASAARVEAADAEALFFGGQSLYDKGAFAAALVAFRASHARIASPNSSLYVARCLRELGRPAEAYDEYARAMREAGDRLVT